MKCLAKIIFLCLAAVIKGQQIFDRPCPERPVQQNFQMERYAGFTYELARYDSAFSVGMECCTGQYDLASPTVFNLTMCCNKPPKTTPDCQKGGAYLSEPDRVPREGKLSVFGQPRNESNYWILSTDYENYSIVYFCYDIEDNKSKELFWLISRQRVLNRAVKKEVIKLMDKYFDINHMVFPKQDAQCKSPKPTFYEVILMHKRHR